MPDRSSSTVAVKGRRSSVAIIRASLLKFVGLLTAVLVLTGYLLIYLAHDLDRTEEIESAFYTKKAVLSLEKNLRSTVKDYAFWGDAYKNLHSKVDIDWAYVRQNVGPTLYADFGIQGVFVVSDADQTVYSVIRGELTSVDASSWLGYATLEVLSKARVGAEAEVPATTFVNIHGHPALVSAAAITPGTDPTVSPDEGSGSVLIFVDILEGSRLENLGKDFGVDGLRVATADELDENSSFALGDKGSAGSLHWNPPKPGERLLGLGLPMVAVVALLVISMAWVILRRTTASALALDASHESLRTSQTALAASEARFRDVAEASSDWIWEIDSQGRFTYLSERFEAVTGLPKDAWIGGSIDDLLRTELGSVTQWLSIPNRRPDISVNCSYIDPKGQQRISRLSAKSMGEHGFLGTATDVTEEVESRKRIEYLSQHDSLTGLPNRTRLREFLDGKLKAQPSAERPLVMLSLDLDRFKPVNDLLGHAAGDTVLNVISSRLADRIRHGDLVARIGGDEFVLILTGLSSQEEVEALCRRLIDAIESPILIGEQEVFVSASIGIAMAPNDASEATELLRYADIALYEAKSSGRNTWRFYAGDMNSKIVERRRLESDLRFAIKHGELRLHFQPRFRISDGKMVGAEALVRWQHPERGLVSPDTFIPIAEETGLILALSNWVMKTAFEFASRWPRELFVSVNLSPSEFKRDNLVGRVRRVIEETKIDPARVELEITENVMLEDASGALEVMRKLKELGVRIAMDDFGTGYSSLGYLRIFPFDGLKIDRSFLCQIGEAGDDLSVIKAIVDLGHALSLTVTAEGIETQEHLELLKSVVCDEGQGYFLSRPLDVDTFCALIRVTEGASRIPG
ncbi:EAL domain-containing protein [Pseudomonas sp. v388]|uniref:bifunctional diguanylate cyclase/phosphodiesterase n=1 Tax=Pseudomonas sp. v388 TaxID=2479849 RepID=UPI000F7B0843|nr:EAL domain-containing protein [Pseudomonas sp. v388]RRV10572.1 EAL domain-containing protein [Pseudomonas sp. v388]